jgi:FkbM family methyltransferase
MTPSILKISIGGVEFHVDPTADPYGIAFWKKLNSNRYEPDTIKFLESSVGVGTIFLDIGAANGAMTLFAAARGAEVVSYEPEEKVFSVLADNVKLNPGISQLVELKRAGISTENETIRFGRGENRKIISDIVVDGRDKLQETFVNILSLPDELISLSNKGKKFVVKMDIEGAEWKILNDECSLEALRSIKATLLVALHPGFYRKSLPNIFTTNSILRNYRRIQNLIDSLKTFKKLDRYGSVKRTNLDAVPNKYRFAFLVLAGYFEFVVEF